MQVLLGHSAEVAKLAFSPDAALLATCSADCSLRVWDTRTGALCVLCLSRRNVCVFADLRPGLVPAGLRCVALVLFSTLSCRCGG